MLKSLNIQHYALIDSLHIEFDKGFSVITGETGAGKSIILGALSLILGQRAEARYIKQNELKCTIEGVFDVSKYNLKSFFEARDWEYDGTECIIRREIWTNGKSRAFVNDSPVYLNDLKELGDSLIDVHSQHQNLSLNDNLFQLTVIDSLAATTKERADYVTSFTDYRKAEKALNDLRELSRRNKEEEDYLRFQFTNLSEANLQAEEQSLLEAELEAITHAEDIKSGLFAVTTLLSGEGQNVETMLKSAMDSLRNVQRVYPRVNELLARVESAYIDLKDVRVESSHLFEEIDFDAERQQILEDRLNLLYDLQKKHSVTTIEELIALRDTFGIKLSAIDSSDEQLIALENDANEKKTAMLERASVLSQKRAAKIPEIEKQLVEQLAFLGMPNVRFVCDFTAKPQPDATGADNVQFLFSANKNAALQPVSQIASGGEISRLMLCIKSMIAGATALPTIIFDEIDTGTSGEIAEKMGVIMHEMGARMQVICITHLPQIASKGNVHFIVYKTDEEDGTRTYMRKLSADGRVDEIARMLSGATKTAAAVENAKAMLGRESAKA